MIRSIPIRQAVGRVLAHDVTRIVPGREKGPAFKKGHIIQESEVPALLKMGKEHIYVLDLKPGSLHENDAAERIARAAAGPGLRLTEPSEGRINLHAVIDGLLKIDIDALTRINGIDDIVFATLHTLQPVRADQAVAGTRVVPLVIAEDPIREAERVCGAAFPLIQVKPYRSRRVGLVTTGSEVYHGRIRGTGIPRPGALAKVTGTCDYGADTGVKMPPETLKLALVQAGISHANIRGIDTAEAENVPGVAKILTP